MYVVTCFTCMMQYSAKHMDIRHAQYRSCVTRLEEEDRHVRK